MDIKQAQAMSQRLREDYLAVARPFGEKAADIIDALIEEVERCDEEYNKVLAEKAEHAQEDIKRIHRIEQKVDALIVERDNLRAENERLRQKMFDESAAMVGIVQFKYPQALAERDALRAQLAQAQDNNEFAPPGGGYLPPTPTTERAPAQRAIATDDPEIYEFWARNKEAEKQEPAKYSDIVSDGGMDPRNKFDVAPVQEPDYKVAIGEWLDKTEWLQEMVSSGRLGSRYLGMHRADVLRDLAYPNTVTGKAPTQREWVGLTDEDIWNSDSIMAANSGYGANFETLRELTRAIEQRLKEKNFS